MPRTRLVRSKQSNRYIELPDADESSILRLSSPVTHPQWETIEATFGTRDLLLGAAAALLVQEVALFHAVHLRVLAALLAAVLLALCRIEPTAVARMIARLPLHQHWWADVRLREGLRKDRGRSADEGQDGNGEERRVLHGGGWWLVSVRCLARALKSGKLRRSTW